MPTSDPDRLVKGALDMRTVLDYTVSAGSRPADLCGLQPEDFGRPTLLKIFRALP